MGLIYRIVLLQHQNGFAPVGGVGFEDLVGKDRVVGDVLSDPFAEYVFRIPAGRTHVVEFAVARFAQIVSCFRPAEVTLFHPDFYATVRVDSIAFTRIDSGADVGSFEVYPQPADLGYRDEFTRMLGSRGVPTDD